MFSFKDIVCGTPFRVHEIVCGTMALNDMGQILLVQEKKLLPHIVFGFPKGHMTMNDYDAIGTAKRELYEETGITDVEYSFPILRFNNANNKTVTLLFAARYHGNNEICIDENEIVTAKWVTYEEFRDLVSFGYVSKVTETVFQQLQS